MSTIKLGFIGSGFVAQQCHLPCFSANPNFQIIGLADPHPKIREVIGRKYGIKILKKNHLELLKFKDIDAFIVTLPRKQTIGVVTTIIDKGKHVFTEKPLCLNSKNGDLLYNLALKRKVALQVGYMKIHDEGTILLKKEMQNLKLDEIICIESYCHMGDSYCNPIGDIKDEVIERISIEDEDLPIWLEKDMQWAYEQFINVFSHITYTTEFIFEDSIKHISSNINHNGEGFISASIKGIPLCIRTIRGKQKEWQEGIDIYTSKQIISIKYPPAFLRNMPASISISSGDDISKNVIIKPSWSWSFYKQTEAFEALIKCKKGSLKNIENANRQVKLAENIFKEQQKHL